MNLFPCVVTMPDGTVVHTCRVIGDADGIAVYAWAASLNTATVIAHAPPVAQQPTSGAEFDLTTADGIVHVRHDPRDCGCGHPMKRWRLAGPARVAANPRP